MNATDLVVGFDEKPTKETKEQKPKARYWLNVGVRLPDGRLASLPMGIALDALKARDVPNSDKNPEFRQLRLAEKQLWEQIDSFLTTMKPGQVSKVAALTCEIRMTEDRETTTEPTVEIPKLTFG